MAKKPTVNKKALDPTKADVVAAVAAKSRGSAPIDAKLNEELKGKVPSIALTMSAGTNTRESLELQKSKERGELPPPITLDIPKAGGK